MIREPKGKSVWDLGMAWDMVASIALVEIILAIENPETDVKLYSKHSNPHSHNEYCRLSEEFDVTR